jgi:hypothetical protein
MRRNLFVKSAGSIGVRRSGMPRAPASDRLVIDRRRRKADDEMLDLALHIIKKIAERFDPTTFHDPTIRRWSSW